MPDRPQTRERTTPDDSRWMQRALALARKGEGCTRPNPPVGAVVVADGQSVGEGYHHAAGKPHAEALALQQAGERAHGASLYVTLEPCSTWGRQPPCTEAVLASGVRRVVVSVQDPNPAHRGRGLRILRKAGVEVVTGVEREDGHALLEPFSKWITTYQPWVTLKMGVTLDGRIADAAGESKWITGTAARREVQALRRRVDAILVGAQTVVKDDPSLWPRPACGRQPWRLVADGRGRVPLTARLLRDTEAAHTVLFTTRACPAARVEAWRALGARVEILPVRGPRLPVRRILQWAGGQGLLHVLCEGGGALAESLVREEAVDEYLFYMAPRLLGGGGIPVVGGRGWPLAAAPNLRFMEAESVGADLRIRARPKMKPKSVQDTAL